MKRSTKRPKRSLTAKAVFVGAALAVIVAQGCSGPETYGQAVTEAGTTPVADILAQPAEYDGKTVRVEGTIATECPSGCWFELQDGGALIYVDLNPNGLAIPQKVGKRAAVEGRVIVEDGRAKIYGMGVEIH
jgi:hypothetical protein